MQTTIRTFLLTAMLASAAMLATVATTAHAQNPGLPFDAENPGYLGNPPLGTPVVRDSAGNCVYTSSYDKERDGLIECGDREPPVAKAEPPAPAPVAFEERITYDATTLFDFDKATLRPDGEAALNELQSQLASYPTVESVAVTGHTDSTGPEVYNQGLSERRAESVADYLSGQGVDRQLMSVQGMGETDPIASNATREGRQQNRRVEVKVNATRKVFK